MGSALGLASGTFDRRMDQIGYSEDLNRSFRNVSGSITCGSHHPGRAILLFYERSTETDVILVLPRGKANREFVRLIVEENQAGLPFRLDMQDLLNTGTQSFESAGEERHSGNA